MVSEGLGVPRVHQEVEPCWREEECDLLEVTFFNEAPPKLGASCAEMGHGEPYLCSSLRDFTLTLEDVARMTIFYYLGRLTLWDRSQRRRSNKTRVPHCRHGCFEDTGQVYLLASYLAGSFGMCCEVIDKGDDS